ncbi:clr5 domain-containing protein [Trichoderma breve]|uniref:Clr5 domain-containing protein n=1 Tax=Trichoderma breve TaxID=2034170 RepID=A0A9W9E4Y7_9HYPO|nr:clr5 domain-containing protein [Trichoderma breve]KAJ4854856.1 clr5 domain-containing protein [Trichoderma breve]
MAGQYPGHNHHNFWNELYDNDLNALASETSGDTGLVTTQSITRDDIMMSLWQHSTSGHVNEILMSELLTPGNGAPPPRPAHPAEMAGSLNEVGSQFDNQPTGDAAYASAEALSTAVDGAQDAPPHVQTNTPAAAAEQPPNQRRPRARPPDPQVWEHHRDAIYSFYMEQNFTLAATMQLMKDHHQFHATEKMYKDKFKQWKWSKNLPKAIAARMLNIAKQRRPKRTIFRWNNRIWPIERIKKLLSRHSAEEDSSLQDDSSIPDDFTYGTPPSSGITDTESVLENSRGTDGDLEMADAATADTTEDLCKFLAEGRCRTNSTPEELYSRAQEALKAAEAGTCNHEEAESALRDAFSYFRHHCSSTQGKTLEIGYLMAHFYVKIGRVNDAHCILDWMTKELCGDTKSCHDRTVTHMLSTITILRRTQRDEEANLLTILLLKHHQTPKAEHFLLQNPSEPYVGSNEMIENLLASSEPEKLASTLSVYTEVRPIDA